MDININSIHFTVDKKLKQLILAKVNKLTTFHDGLINADVNLKLDKSESKENKISEVKVFLKGGELFAKKQSNTFEEAIGDCVEAMRRQLLKHKEKERNI